MLFRSVPLFLPRGLASACDVLHSVRCLLTPTRHIPYSYGWFPQVHLRLPPIMPVDQPFNIYQEQLSSQYHGLALWDPTPVQGLFNDLGHVSIGDVGYLDKGQFIRILNVKLPRDNPNKFIEIPEGYKPLKREHF